MSAERTNFSLFTEEYRVHAANSSIRLFLEEILPLEKHLKLTIKQFHNYSICILLIISSTVFFKCNS